MKRWMKGKRIGLIFGLLCMALCTVLVMPQAEAKAASEKSAALLQYRTYLEGKGTNAAFALIYLDKNSVPELICKPGAFESPVLYTYKNGAMMKIYGLNSQSGYSYYKKTGILCQSYGHGNMYGELLVSDSYYKVDGDRLAGKLSKYESSYRGKKSVMTYFKTKKNGQDKKISSAKFRTEMKKLTGGKKATRITLRSNTDKNRRKYLK